MKKRTSGSAAQPSAQTARTKSAYGKKGSRRKPRFFRIFFIVNTAGRALYAARPVIFRSQFFLSE